MMIKVIVILFSGVLLIPILLMSLVSQTCRIKLWHSFNKQVNTYPVIPDNKIDQLFTLCVNFLLILGRKLGMSYNEINIWIFCIIWPLLTLVLFVLAII